MRTPSLTNLLAKTSVSIPIKQPTVLRHGVLRPTDLIARPITPEAMVERLFEGEALRLDAEESAEEGGMESMMSLPEVNVVSNAATAAGTRRSSFLGREVEEKGEEFGARYGVGLEEDGASRLTRVEMWLKKNSMGGHVQESEDVEVDTRNKEEEEMAREMFERELRVQHGWQVLNVVEDSCCLFRVFAEDVLGDEERHGELRQQCAEYMLKHASRYSGFVEGSFDEYVSRMTDLSTPGTDLEVHVISDLLGVIVEMHQIQDGTPKSRLVILHPTTTAAEDECANGDARVTMCAVGAGRYHRLAAVSKAAVDSIIQTPKNVEKARGTNDSSDDDLKMAIMLSLQDASSLPPLHPTTKPFAATTSTTSIASGSSASKPKLDSLLKVAGGVKNGSGSGSSMDDEEFEALQAVLEVSLRESKRVEQPEKLRTGGRRVSFSGEVKVCGGEGGYDEDEALRAAIEASRREMEVTAEEEDGEVSTKRWKGKERA